MIWFGVAGGAAALGLSLVWKRHVRKDPDAVRAGGGHTLFALFMVLFAVGALIAGLASSEPGR